MSDPAINANLPALFRRPSALCRSKLPMWQMHRFVGASRCAIALPLDRSDLEVQRTPHTLDTGELRVLRAADPGK